MRRAASALQYSSRIAPSLVCLCFGKNVASTEESAKISWSDDNDLSRLSPIAPIRIFRPNPNLEIAFDVRTRNPIYVLECLIVSHGSQSNRKRHHFHEEASLPEPYRSRNSYYHRTGYDRGHLAPAADFYHDSKQLADTFNLCNVSPQVHSMNRKLWATLEHWTRKVAEKASNDNHQATTYVVTGPLWLPQRQVADKIFQFTYPAIGKPPSLISVPTHFFKVVVVIHESRITQFACFVIPNDDIDANKTLQDYVVQWTDLETVSGLHFFPTLTQDYDWKATADALTVGEVEQVLLLTDGSSTNSKRHRPVVKDLVHLCGGGQCILPKKR